MPILALSLFAGCEDNSANNGNGDPDPGPASLTITGISQELINAGAYSVELFVFPKDYEAYTASLSLDDPSPDLLAAAKYASDGASNTITTTQEAGSAYTLTAELRAIGDSGITDTRWTANDNYAVYLKLKASAVFSPVYYKAVNIHIEGASTTSVDNFASVTPQPPAAAVLTITGISEKVTENVSAIWLYVFPKNHTATAISDTNPAQLNTTGHLALATWSSAGGSNTITITQAGNTYTLTANLYTPAPTSVAWQTDGEYSVYLSLLISTTGTLSYYKSNSNIRIKGATTAPMSDFGTFNF